MTFNDKRENLMNEMVCLSEVRGELDSVSNEKVEVILGKIGDELRAIDEARDELFDHFANL